MLNLPSRQEEATWEVKRIDIGMADDIDQDRSISQCNIRRKVSLSAAFNL